MTTKEETQNKQESIWNMNLKNKLETMRECRIVNINRLTMIERESVYCNVFMNQNMFETCGDSVKLVLGTVKKSKSPEHTFYYVEKLPRCDMTVRVEGNVTVHCASDEVVDVERVPIPV